MKNIAKLGFICLTGLLTLTACDGSLISREQARQVLQMIQKAQEKIKTTPLDESEERRGSEEADIDISRLYGEEISISKSRKEEFEVQDESTGNTWKEPLVTSINLQVSLKNKYVYVSYSESLGTFNETKKAGYEYWYFLKSNFYYSSEREYDTTKESVGETTVKKGTKDIEEASKLFMEKFREYKTKAYTLIEMFDRVDSFIDFIDRVANEPKQRLVYDSYHTKKNDHIVGAITRYTSTSRDRKEYVLNFTYADNLLKKYDYEDVSRATDDSMLINYFANTVKPATFPITDSYPTESESDSQAQNE